jgi:hypothetical protein
MFIKYFASLAVNQEKAIPSKVHTWRFLKHISLEVVSKPDGFGANTSLVINSSDPKMLGVIMVGRNPSRIVYSDARYEETYPPNVYTKDQYSEIKSMLHILNLPYPSSSGLVLPILESLLTTIGIKYDKDFSANIQKFSNIYQNKFPKSSSALWPLHN